MKETIRLERIARDGNRLKYDFESTLPYFRKRSFFVEYDGSLDGVPDGVAAVPFAAAMAPVAWASGARLTMGELDAPYLASLDRCRDYFRSRFQGRWSFDSEIEATPAANDTQPAGAGMLFSSGLDSLTTYIRRKAERPALYTIFGTDIPLAHQSFIDLCKRRFDAFAAEQGAELHYLSTDVREAFDFERLKRYSKNWYGDVAHGLMMSGIVAPSSYGRIRTLYVASCSHRTRLGHACGSDADLLQRIHWSGTGVRNDNQDLSRAEKIALYLKGNEAYYPSLRVCWTQFRSLNCSRCEKCLRTICELLANNVDPSRCNFTMGPDTLAALRRRMETQYYLFFHSETTLDFWRSLQEDLDIDAIRDMHGSKAFFEWFVEFRRLRRKQSTVLRGACAALLEARDSAYALASSAKKSFSPVSAPLKGVRL